MTIAFHVYTDVIDRCITTDTVIPLLLLLLVYHYCLLRINSFPALAGDGSKRPHRQHSDDTTTAAASSAVRQAPVQKGTVVSGRGVVLAPSDQNKLAAAMTEAALKHARSVNAKVKAMAQ
eukprot:1781-Heterococcus_DN1.PRE.2